MVRLIFNRKFWSLSSRKESRITSLLDILGLSNRIIYFDEKVPNDLTLDINYVDANAKFEQYRQNALSVIKEMIHEN